MLWDPDPSSMWSQLTRKLQDTGLGVAEFLNLHNVSFFPQSSYFEGNPKIWILYCKSITQGFCFLSFCNSYSSSILEAPGHRSLFLCVCIWHIACQHLTCSVTSWMRCRFYWKAPRLWIFPSPSSSLRDTDMHRLLCYLKSGWRLAFYK